LLGLFNCLGAAAGKLELLHPRIEIAGVAVRHFLAVVEIVGDVGQRELRRRVVSVLVVEV
jgi:hypothetical protein